MFRLGDFYELFFDDALKVSKELDLTLTSRACGLKEKAPMCGVPYHSVGIYIKSLAEKGYKIAICEQVEDPKVSKGIVKREVTRIITPGTVDLVSEIDGNDNAFIASIFSMGEKISISYADITTGELIAAGFDNNDYNSLISLISLINPREILIYSEIDKNLVNIISSNLPSAYINVIDDSYYKTSNCVDAIKRQFEVRTLMSLGIKDIDEIICSCGSLLLYLMDTQMQDLSNIMDLEIRNNRDYMILDRTTVRNLELLKTIHDDKEIGSLFGILNKTKTSMGERLLKRYIKEPLLSKDKIKLRQDSVECLINNRIAGKELIDQLKRVYDFQRLSSKISSGRVNARDLNALKQTLSTLPKIKEILSSLDSELINTIREEIEDFHDLYNLIDKSIEEEPPITIKEGEIIREGYSEKLDKLKNSISGARIWINELEAYEKERTGIKTLKVGHNKVFGYYIDVSKSQIDNVPEEYIRKQTLVNNERYITPELKEKEALVATAETQINKLEYDLFQEIRREIIPYTEKLQRASKSIAQIDVLLSFSETAILNGYVKPIVDDSNIIDIKDGRHPSVEALLGDGMFIPNDTILGLGEAPEYNKSMLIITGPNMSGKSTYMRQTAVIALMAQIGSFVPAKSARIGIVDRIFTRIGASDNLSYGQSTFFVEMSELAHILRNATSNSLVILDEVGRGTSTFDGLSIAWATAEYLSKKECPIRTMFATHYHELTQLESEINSVKNLSVSVSDNGKDVVFLHKIVEGPANKSYGIHVAKIAGVPLEIRVSAEKKLRSLELSSSFDKSSNYTEQISFSNEILYEELKEKYDNLISQINEINTDNITPIDALLKLDELKNKVLAD